MTVGEMGEKDGEEEIGRRGEEGERGFCSVTNYHSSKSSCEAPVDKSTIEGERLPDSRKMITDYNYSIAVHTRFRGSEEWGQ